MKISFVVPTRNSARTLESCLRSLRIQADDAVEIIVVDNWSTDATADIGRTLADRFVRWGPERSAQRNRGTRSSAGDAIVFLDSDMVLEPHAARQIRERFARDPALGALVIPERSFGVGFLARCRCLEKRLYVGDERVEAPRVFRRPVIDALGGWDETLTAAEDWDLADRARAAGVRVGRVDAWIWHDEGRIWLRTAFAKKRYYGRWIGRYLRLHASRGHGKLVRTALLQQPGLLLRHPLLTGGMAVLKATEALGLLLGVLDARRTAAGLEKPA